MIRHCPPDAKAGQVTLTQPQGPSGTLCPLLFISQWRQTLSLVNPYTTGLYAGCNGTISRMWIVRPAFFWYHSPLCEYNITVRHGTGFSSQPVIREKGVCTASRSRHVSSNHAWCEWHELKLFIQPGSSRNHSLAISYLDSCSRLGLFDHHYCSMIHDCQS